MADFLKNEYTASINKRNRKLAFRKRTICHLYKTVDYNEMTPEEIHALGLKVARYNAEMEKKSGRFEGTLLEFFDYVRNKPG
jgi:uncharacterized protein (DUF885 family)